MQGAYGKFGVGSLDQDGDLDLGGGDGADVDTARRKGLEAGGGNARVAAHADADHRDLGDVHGGLDLADDLGPVDDVAGALELGLGHREGDVGVGTVLRDVLHDHVDVDAGLGERHEDRGGDAGLVGHVPQRDLGLVLRIGDAGDDLLFHDVIL